MRAYRCDQCQKTVEAWTKDASEFVELNRAETPVEPNHFCSTRCLAAWASKVAERTVVA